MNDWGAVFEAVTGIASFLSLLIAVQQHREKHPRAAKAYAVLFLALLIVFIFRRGDLGKVFGPGESDPGRKGTTSVIEPQPTSRRRPAPLPKPKPYITRAGEPITVGDFTFLMKECKRGDWLVCTGTVVNRSEYRRSVTLTGGSSIDDSGVQN